jgi:hypothetical protein
MNTKFHSLFLVVGGIALALVLSYYLNMRFDHKAVIAYLKTKIKSTLSS